jgi:hypothetical protein
MTRKMKLVRSLAPAAPLEQVVADLRGEAAVLDRSGAKDLATAKRLDADRIAAACPDALTWLSETDCRLRTGWTLARVRRHAAQYEGAGTARRISKRGPWQLLAIIVPQRLPTSVLEHAARQAAAS